MSGHSKWHNIKIRKSKVDSMKAKLFTKVSKEILMAVKEGGPEPETNFRLKVAVQRARDANMPVDNIKRTIEKASGSGAVEFEEIIYEGYGPYGVAMMLDVATDNRNRTAAEVRRLFTKYGGNLGETGCVAWMFEKRGVIFIKENSAKEDELLSVALDAGALDIENMDDGYEIATEPSKLSAVRAALDENKIKYESCEITWIPQNNVKIENEEEASRLIKLVEDLEELDDVQQVYANFDILQNILENIT